MNFTLSRGYTFLAWTAVFVCTATLAADPLEFPRQQHPWGKFPLGSWKSVRTTSETLDEKGHVTAVTVTSTRTTLIGSDETTYTLRSEATLDVLGRRIATTPHVAKYGYYGESPGQVINVKVCPPFPVAMPELDHERRFRQVCGHVRFASKSDR